MLRTGKAEDLPPRHFATDKLYVLIACMISLSDNIYHNHDAAL